MGELVTVRRQQMVVTVAVSLVGLAIAGGGIAEASPAAPGSPSTTRVSVSSSEDQVPTPSFDSAISVQGRYVVFTSAASRLVAGDSNHSRDVFVRDRSTGVTQRVSVSTGGAQGNNDSTQPAISADGRYVAFISAATNLIPTDTNHSLDVFVRDRVAKVTRRVSIASDGQADNGDSRNPSISADGRYVAFESWAKHLVTGDTNGAYDVFVRDRTRNVTRRVSVGTGGSQATGWSLNPAISADGQHVAFESLASDLVAGDHNGQADVFVRDRDTQETIRVSVSSSGVEGNRASHQPDISADGQRVVFQSKARILIAGDTNATSDVFVRDLVEGTTERVSVTNHGAQANNYSFQPAISADGSQVAFFSDATNLIASDTNSTSDVFVRHLVDMTTRRVSVADGGGQANGYSFQPAISAHGRYVSFTSAASNLIARDTNGDREVFVRDRGTG